MLTVSRTLALIHLRARAHFLSSASREHLSNSNQLKCIIFFREASPAVFNVSETTFHLSLERKCLIFTQIGYIKGHLETKIHDFRDIFTFYS